MSSLSSTYAQSVLTLPPSATAKQLADPISRSQAEYNHYLNLASREDFTAIRSHNILYNAGKDRDGRTIVVFVAHNIPATKIDLESLFLFAIGATTSPHTHTHHSTTHTPHIHRTHTEARSTYFSSYTAASYSGQDCRERVHAAVLPRQHSQHQ